MAEKSKSNKKPIKKPKSAIPIGKKKKTFKTYTREWTDKQRLFVYHYNGDNKKACEKAGLSRDYGKKLCTLKRYKHVQEAIQEKMERAEKNCGMSLEWLLTRYKWLINYNLKDIFDDDGNIKPISEIPDEALFAITTLESKVLISQSKETETKKIQAFLKKLKSADRKSSLDSVAEILGHKRRNIFDPLPDDEEIKKITVEFVKKGDANVSSKS